MPSRCATEFGSIVRQTRALEPDPAGLVSSGQPFHRSSTPRTMVRSLASASLATAMISSMRTGCKASGRHMSVTIENPRTFMPAWTATRTSGTVDIPTTSAPMPRRKRYSARVSRFGPDHRDIDTAMGDDVLLERDFQRQILKLAIVRLDQVGKSGTEPIVVGADQGVQPHQVDVVFDDDQVALVVERVQPARGIGDDQEPAAQLLHHPDRKGHLPGRITLVEVKPPFHRDDRLTGQLAADQLPLVALDGRPWEKGDLGVGDRRLGLDLASQGAQARAQDQADPRASLTSRERTIRLAS